LNSKVCFLIISDDFNDFTDGVYRESSADRDRVEHSRQQLWGQKYFILPGPTYGSWTSSATLPAPIVDRLTLPSRDLEAMPSGE
jgi:predicted secreted acid phosphatase